MKKLKITGLVMALLLGLTAGAVMAAQTALNQDSFINVLLSGYFKVGNGTPGQTLDAEDAYVEGTLEVDDVLYSDAGLMIPDDIDLIFGNGSDVSVQYDEGTSDRLIITTVGASGLNVLTGNMFIGNGTPGQTLNGEDMYVEGLFELDGVGYLDGGAKIPDDMTLVLGTGNDATLVYDELTDDLLKLTIASATGGLQVLTGNVFIGNGVPGQTLNGEDLYVEGLSEFGAMVYADAGVTIADDMPGFYGTDQDVGVYYDETTTDRLLVEAMPASGLNVITGNLWVGNGTAGVAAMDGEDLYVEGASEFDGAMQLDGAVTFGLAASFVAGLNTSTTASLEITTNSLTRKRKVAPIGYLSATEFQTGGPFSSFTSIGIEGGGPGVTGAVDSYVSLGDAADSLVLGLAVPELATLGAAADFEIEFDLIEDTDEECNIDVVIYEYGSNVAIVTDTITMANGAARAWQDLDTLATGIGALVDVSDYLIIQITANADTDNFKLYGARVTYSVGVENNVN